MAEEQPSNLKQLENVIKKVWTLGITSEYCCKLIESMPRCLKMVIDNKGGHKIVNVVSFTCITINDLPEKSIENGFVAKNNKNTRIMASVGIIGRDC